MSVRNRYIKVTFKPTKQTIIYESVDEAEKDLNLARSTIFNYIRGKYDPPVYMKFEETTKEESNRYLALNYRRQFKPVNCDLSCQCRCCHG